VQIVVNAINEAIGANGKTIDWSAPYVSYQGVDADFAKLVDEMNAGAVANLLIYSANPAYTWVDTAKVISGLKKVKTAVSFSGVNDETTQLCKYVIPSHHYLESWGDAEIKAGYFSFVQPTINPLFKTRQWQDSLLKWSGATTDYASFLKTYWTAKLGGEAGWNKTLQEGVVNAVASETLGTASFNSSAVAGAASAVAAKGKGKYELALYQKISVGATNGASNPWLQELPDPVTKATWDNYLIVSPKLAKELLKIDLNDNGQADAYEVNPPKKVVKITVGGKSISLPALIIPGTHPETVGIALGYGRTDKLGKQ